MDYVLLLVDEHEGVRAGLYQIEVLEAAGQLFPLDLLIVGNLFRRLVKIRVHVIFPFAFLLIVVMVMVWGFSKASRTFFGSPSSPHL